MQQPSTSRDQLEKMINKIHGRKWWISKALRFDAKHATEFSQDYWITYLKQPSYKELEKKIYIYIYCATQSPCQ